MNSSNLSPLFFSCFLPADVSTGKARRDEEARVAAVVAAARAEVS